MSRDSAMRRWVLPALWLGAASGGIEIAVRADPRLGLDEGQMLAWWGAAVGLNALLCVCTAVIASLRWSQVVGPVIGMLVAMHGGMIWRFDFAVNRYIWDPVLWVVSLLILLVSVGIGVWVQRSERRCRMLLRGAKLTAVLTPAVALLMSVPVTADVEASGPNVVVITLDTTRADRLGAYGSANQTPNIDALARDGVVFDTVVTPSPLTEPAHLALFTGQPPHVTGVVSNGTHIGDRPDLLYRQLSDMGYATAGFVAAFPLHARYGWAQGMDVYDDDFGAMPGLHRLNLVKAWDQVVLRQHVLRERRGDLVVDRAVSWLEHTDKPFMMWLHLFDAHGPYEAPGHPYDPSPDAEPVQSQGGELIVLPRYWPDWMRLTFDVDWIIGAYEAEVRYADVQVGRLIDALQAKGVLDDTIVVLTADHGESLTENGLMFDHGDDLFEPSLRIPLIIRYPAAARAGHRVPCLVSNMDVAPTVRGLLGRAPGEGVHGVDRSAALSGAPCKDSPLVATTVVGRFVSPPPVAHALRVPDQKALRGPTGDEQCFAVGAAVADEEEMPGCPGALIDALEQALESRKVPIEPASDKTTEEALRALGYVE